MRNYFNNTRRCPPIAYRNNKFSRIIADQKKPTISLQLWAFFARPIIFPKSPKPFISLQLCAIVLGTQYNSLFFPLKNIFFPEISKTIIFIAIMCILGGLTIWIPIIYYFLLFFSFFPNNFKKIFFHLFFHSKSPPSKPKLRTFNFCNVL